MANSSRGVMALYDPVLMKHARKPYGFGGLQGARSACDTNRPCGDRVCFHVHDMVVRFEGEGCALAIGAASALCEAVDGRQRDEAYAIASALLEVLNGTQPVMALVGDLAHFAATRDFPARRGCVSLASLVLCKALGDPHEGGPP